MLWFVFAPIDLLVSFLAFPLAPIIVLLSFETVKPPFWAWPWLTPDNPIDGDAGHLERWPDNGSCVRVFMRRVAWLWRNRGYGFSEAVTGRDVIGRIKWIGNRSVSDNPLSPGVVIGLASGGVWELYAYVPWLPSLKRGLRVRLGWKIPCNLDCADTPVRVSLVTHINPLKGYR